MLSESEIILFSKTYNHPIWNCLPIGSTWNSPEQARREEGALQLWRAHCVIRHVCLQRGVPPSRYFYPLFVWGQGCVGDKCLFVLLCVSHALNSGCQAWGQCLLSQVSVPVFLSVPELWDTPLTFVFWHSYPFSFLSLAVHGWSLWTVLSHAAFPRQGRVVTKRMREERADSWQAIPLLWGDLAKCHR